MVLNYALVKVSEETIQTVITYVLVIKGIHFEYYYSLGQRIADNKELKTILSFKENHLKDLRLEGEAARTISPAERLRVAFEFLEFAEAFYEAGNKNLLCYFEPNNKSSSSHI